MGTTTGGSGESTPGDLARQGLPEPGDILANKYRIESVLGRGGMGIVYRAHHELLHETVVIKVVLGALDESARARFMREARAAFQIKSDHVARVFDIDFLDSGKPFMVLEHLEGEDLARALHRQDAAFEPGLAVDYVLQVLDALSAAHAIGIVHRDLKPANLFLVRSPDGRERIKVLDFGIAKSTRTTEELTMARIALGTPQYMSPEQLQDTRSVDARTDIWSVGAILFELLTLERPFPGQDALAVYRAIRAGPAPSVRARVPRVPAALSAIVARCLMVESEHRYANVAELARELAPFASTPSSVVASSASADVTPKVLDTAATVDAVVPSYPPRDREPTVQAFTQPLPSPSLQRATATGAPATPSLRPERRAWFPYVRLGAVALGLGLLAIVARFVAFRSPDTTASATPGVEAGAAPEGSIVSVASVVALAPSAPAIVESASSAPVSSVSPRTTPRWRPPPPPRPRPATPAVAPAPAPAAPAPTSFDPTAARKL